MVDGYSRFVVNSYSQIFPSLYDVTGATADPTVNYVLQANGDGTVSWVIVGSGGSLANVAFLNVAQTWTASQTYNDSVRLYLGTGQDSYWEHDGSNTIYNYQGAGAGNTYFRDGGSNRFYITNTSVNVINVPLVLNTGVVITSADEDLSITLGRSLLSSSTTDFAVFSHRDMITATNFGLMQSPVGATYLNASSGQKIRFQVNGATIYQVDNDSVDLQSGADLNLSSGSNFNMNGTVLQLDEDGTNGYVKSSGRLYFEAGGGASGNIVGTNWNILGNLTVANFIGINTSDIEAWASPYKALESKLSAVMLGDTNSNIGLISNAYYDGAYKYKSTGIASQYLQTSGEHWFRRANSGTIDTSVTWDTMLKITSVGLTLGGNILRDDDISAFNISGGNATNVGANINLYGGAHTTLAGDFRVRTGSSIILDYDKSALRWFFDGGAYWFDSNSGTYPVYITRAGGIDQALKIHVDDSTAYINHIQDETINQASLIRYDITVQTGNEAIHEHIFQIDGTAVMNVGATGNSATSPFVNVAGDINTEGMYALRTNGDVIIGWLNDSTWDSGESIVHLKSPDTTVNSDNYWISFKSTAGAIYGSINSEVVYSTFTGGHEGQNLDEKTDAMTWREGLIVSSTGILPETTSISRALPYIEISNKIKDKAVMGVFTYCQKGHEGKECKMHMHDDCKENCEKTHHCNVGHHAYGMDTENQLISYNAVGEGKLLITDEFGEPQLGDYITTSEINGIGMLQDDDILHNYTVAKVTETIDWNSIPIDEEFGIKIYLSACTYHCG